MTVDADVPPAGAPKIKPLLRAMEFGGGFSLHLAIANSAVVRTDVINAVRAAVPGSIIDERCVDRPTRSLLRDLQKTPPPQEAAAVFVYGLEKWIGSEISPEGRGFILNLNAARESFGAVLHCPLILFLPHYLLGLVCALAPDFISVRSATYTFAEPSVMPGPQPGPLFPAEADSSTAEQRRSFLADADQMLARLPRFGEADYDPRTIARILRDASQTRISLGDFDRALEDLYTAAALWNEVNDEGERAITLSSIADIYFYCGEWDKALRIRREEELQVYEKLGDIRSRAITMGQIADILEGRGDIEEALRIFREVLRVFEKLGDIRARAVTMGKVADILKGQGDTEEALRIYREEELPVYEKLGDLRERAITMGQIADILQGRGDIEEALRIFREVLRVFEKLGDIRARAVTMGKVADILKGQGDTEEALRIYREEVLRVFEKLGDIRSRAITMGKVADILKGQGDTEEALRIRREEELPIYEKLGDIRSSVITMGQIAEGLIKRGSEGDAQEARRLLELAVEAAHRLGIPAEGQIKEVIDLMLS